MPPGDDDDDDDDDASPGLLPPSWPPIRYHEVPHTLLPQPG
ncbi:hypothetical protein AG0111_0g2453 [Alternaria gaisen]|uniref:Uncharacterized protein n=1 Tax=Alternaria gaisen TaxID=167740 RepID=A0ACB6G4U1_9PLEO|nr:hypothetical protein AG0111_0g2453 [Alternaria gaisen]